MFKIKIITSIITFLFISSISQANLNIVYIDMDYIFNNSKAGKSINDQIESKKNDNKKKVKISEDEIKKESQNINNQQNILSEDEIKIRIDSLNKKIKNLQNKVKENNNLIAKMKLELSGMKTVH